MKAIEFPSVDSAVARAEQEKREGYNALMYYSQKQGKWYVVRGSSGVITAIELSIAGAVGIGHALRHGTRCATMLIVKRNNHDSR